MYRFTLILVIVSIVAIASFSVQAESDESEMAAEKSRIPGWFRVDTESVQPIPSAVSRLSLISSSTIPSESLTSVFPSPLSKATISALQYCPCLDLGMTSPRQMVPSQSIRTFLFYARRQPLFQIVDNRHPLFRV